MRHLLIVAMLLIPTVARARTLHAQRRHRHHLRHLHHRHLRARHVQIWRGATRVRPSAAPSYVELPARAPAERPQREVKLAGVPYVGPELSASRDALWKWESVGQ